ncbi:MAG: hypothetical protein V6Z86_10020 [Hyphomicrobiales bacterium]
MSNDKSAPRDEKTPVAAEPAKQASSAVPVLLHRDYWGRDGVRHAKGSVVSVAVVTAKRLIGEGKAERADPLPGES